MTPTTFEEYWESRQGCLLTSVKDSHRQTWESAQQALISESGAAVFITTVDERSPVAASEKVGV